MDEGKEGTKKTQTLSGYTFFPSYFPGGSYGKASVCNAGDPGSIPGSG